MAGYAGVSITASTVVGGVWLYQAYLARGAVAKERGALRLVPLVLLAATAMVPPIAVVTSRDPDLGQGLAHSFLALLFLLAMLPAALRRIGAGPLDARVLLPSAVLAAAHLGAAPSLPGRVGLAVMAAQVGWTVGRSRVKVVYVVAWGLFGLGGLALAAVPVPSHNLAIGGVHYLLLGALFVSLVRPRPAAAWGALMSAAAMAAALGPVGGLAPGLVQPAAGLAGAAWAGFAVWGLLGAAAQR